MTATKSTPAPAKEEQSSAGPLLLELADMDDLGERLQQSLSFLRGCMDAGVACVRAAQSLMHEQAKWRASVNREPARAQIPVDPQGTIAKAMMALADDRVAGLLDLYVECTKPLGLSVEDKAAELANLEERRQAVVRELPPELAVRYRALRTGTRFPYISEVVGGRCAGCNLQLPTILAQEVVRGRSDLCPTCGRILCGTTRGTRAPSRDETPAAATALYQSGR